MTELVCVIVIECVSDIENPKAENPVVIEFSKARETECMWLTVLVVEWVSV